MNDWTMEPIGESLKLVSNKEEPCTINAESYIKIMYDAACERTNGKFNLLTKLRTFIQRIPGGYHYSAHQIDTIMLLIAKLAAALNYSDAKPFIKYEETGSTVWHKS